MFAGGRSLLACGNRPKASIIISEGPLDLTAIDQRHSPFRLGPVFDAWQSAEMIVGGTWVPNRGGYEIVAIVGLLNLLKGPPNASHGKPLMPLVNGLMASCSLGFNFWVIQASWS